MTCDEHKEQISLLLDSELENGSQRTLFKHLSECAGCQQFLDSVILLREMRKKESITFPSEIDDALFARLNIISPVRNRVAAREQSRSWFRRRLLIPVPAAIALTILVIAIGLLLGMQTVQPQGASTLFTTGAFVNGKQQPAVIFIYGIPEVHVIDSTPAKVKDIKNQTIF
ncbi:MAG: hypothetical protein EPO24_12125 [Bacteroidetes bacterium]|nr:MAG: hypothetical protein EPO24_12125 [Bacteroidota bacterium]